MIDPVCLASHPGVANTRRDRNLPGSCGLALPNARSSSKIDTMRISILTGALLLAGLAPAAAVVRGEVARDPDGVRQSVVRIESSKGELCSGALIGYDLVLTAAHCLTEQATYRVIGVDRGFRQRSLKAVAAAVHPDFVPGTNSGCTAAAIALSGRWRKPRSTPITR